MSSTTNAENSTTTEPSSEKRSSSDITGSPDRLGSKSKKASSREQGNYKKRNVSTPSIKRFLFRPTPENSKGGTSTKGNNQSSTMGKSGENKGQGDSKINKGKKVGFSEDLSSEERPTHRITPKDPRVEDVSSGEEDDDDPEDITREDSDVEVHEVEERNQATTPEGSQKPSSLPKSKRKQTSSSTKKKSSPRLTASQLRSLNHHKRVVVISLKVLRSKGDIQKQVQKALSSFLAKLRESDEDLIIGFLPWTGAGRPPIMYEEDFPTTLRTLSSHYWQTPNNAFREFRPDNSSKTIQISITLGANEDVTDLLRSSKDDIDKIPGFFITEKSLQVVYTDSSNLLTGVPGMYQSQPQIVLPILQSILKVSAHLMTTTDPSSFPPEEFLPPPKIGVTTSRPQGLSLPYSAEANRGDRMILEIQVEVGEEDKVKEILDHAYATKAIDRAFGPFARNNKVPKTYNDSSYVGSILTSISFQSSIAYIWFDQMKSITARETLTGLFGQVSDRDTDVNEILRSLEIRNSHGDLQKIICAFYDSHRAKYCVAFIDDTDVKSYLQQFLLNIAANIFHYCKRRGYVKKSIVALLRKSMYLQGLANVDSSTYDRKTGLAVIKNSTLSKDESIGFDPSNLFGLTPEEVLMYRQAFKIVDIPAGHSLDAAAKTPGAGSTAVFTKDSMSVRSHKKDENDVSVKTYRSFAPPRNDDDSSIDSEEFTGEESDDFAKTLDGISAEVVELVQNMSPEARKEVLVETWQEHGSQLEKFLYEEDPDKEAEEYFCGLNMEPVYLIREIVLLLSDAELMELPFNEHFLAIKEACNTEENDEQSNQDGQESGEGVSNMEVDESGEDVGHQGSDLPRGIDTSCVHTQNEPIVKMLLIRHSDYSQDPGNAKARAIAYLKAAKSVRDLNFVITPENAKSLGESNHENKVSGIGPSISNLIFHFVYTGLPLDGVNPRYTFSPPSSAYQVFYNVAGPSVDGLKIYIKMNCDALQHAIDNAENHAEFSPETDALELVNQEALFFLKQVPGAGENLGKLVFLLNEMLQQLEVDAVKVRPPFDDHFTPLPLSEPPSSSGTTDSQSNQELGDSSSDGSEDGTG
jgi:hypothetical protein